MLRKSIILITLIIFIAIFVSFKELNNSSSEIKKSPLEIDNYSKEEFYGYLKIPSINMNLGFYNYDSPLNNVEYNIELIEIPIEGSYLIAGHSGVGAKAFFNDLHNLQTGDDIYLDIENNTYHYIVDNIYRVKKTGSINISNAANMLYLTTCDQIVSGYQLVIEGIKV